MKKNKIPKVLIILDGWGVAPASKGNAISLAKTPNFDKLQKHFPYTLLNATGKAVGLSENEMSGSEAGHENIGAGRIVKQDSQYISESISNGSFFQHSVVRRLVDYVKTNKSSLHLMGLLTSKDSPHGDPDHIDAFLTLAKMEKIENVYLHLFTDGRDTLQREAKRFLNDLEKMIKLSGVGKIASVTGRFYAMDRVKNWDRLYNAYNTIVNGKGVKVATAKEAIDNAYEKGFTDEFIEPTVICAKKKVKGRSKIEPVGTIKNNDAVVFFNLRSDRARQLTKLFVLNKVDGYKRPESKLDNLFFVAMTDFGPDLPVSTLFQSKPVEKTLPFVLRGLKQLYIAETEKYAHITYFLNGGYANPVAGEERIMIASPKVSSYAQKPEMSAFVIADLIAREIKNDIYDFMAINFANADMVGHTGDLIATIKGVEAVDKCVGQVIEAVKKKNGIVFITADHGNADKMIDKRTGGAWTMHTKNPVPFAIVGAKGVKKLKKGGVLGSITPTILDVLDIKKPKEMKEKSLIGK